MKNRTHFINPYTFIPLAKNGPLLKDKNNANHALFEPDSFTGLIRCELNLITPAVIPGEQTARTDHTAGKINAYTYDNRLAIPGSRLRGDFLNLMRSINSSPIIRFEDRVILERKNGTHKKGFVFRKKADGTRWIQELDDEILVVSTSRRKTPDLQKGAKAKVDSPEIYDKAGNPIDIPEFDPETDLSKQGVRGTLYWQKVQGASYKHYHCKKVAEKALSPEGRWVKFACWSGQDRDNKLKDINDKIQMHDNAWHLADLDGVNSEKQYSIDDHLIKSFDKCVEEMARLTVDKALPGNSREEIVRQMSPLAPGLFVYFELNHNKKVVSLGRHYRYLFRKGTVDDKAAKANELLSDSDPTHCLVRQLSGWASEGEDTGMKSRLWVEMAFGPKKNEVRLEEKNLRILSSQPPKAASFYLKDDKDTPSYDKTTSRIRGRKFYWHDPKWNQKMWDNEDLGQGEYAFENPVPTKYKKQWSRAEVIMATQKNPVGFNLTIRVMNLSHDELNLLLTALLGFSPDCFDDNSIGQRNYLEWCHKIGHARPFMGSGYITVKEVKALSFNQNTWEPELGKVDLQKWQVVLGLWQNQHLKGKHLEGLKRVMKFNGAYEDLGSQEKDARLTYPLGQERQQALTWVGTNKDVLPEANQPKTYIWFGQNRQIPPLLPDPLPGTSQALPVYLKQGRSGHRDSRTALGQRGDRQTSFGLGTLSAAFKKAGAKSQTKQQKGIKRS